MSHYQEQEPLPPIDLFDEDKDSTIIDFTKYITDQTWTQSPVNLTVN